MRKLSFLFLELVGFLPANAQYTFTCNGGFSGDCAKVSGVRELNQQLQQIMRQAFAGFPDEASCNQARNIVNNIKSQAEIILGGKRYNCHFKLNALPCTGRPIGGTNVGTPNVLGVSQGSSFFSTNTVNDIKNWSEDDMERMLALDQKHQPLENKAIATGDVYFDRTRSTLPVIDPDKPFRSLNVDENLGSNDYSADLSMRDGFSKVEMANDFSLLANKENVQRYVDASQGLTVPYLVNPQDITQLLHMDFKLVSGFDVDAIMQKLPSERTDAEKQALNDYKQYRTEVIEKMADEIDVIIDNSKDKKELDGAILAYDVYGTDKDNYLQYTNYNKVQINEIEDGNPIKNVAEAINICNETRDDTGIHVELYYNSKTNTYVISCAGSDDKEDWLYNNAANALGGEVPQYNMAKVIADAIDMIPKNGRDNLNIEVVGHSLGGGMASIIGLVTGINTKTYNAARVPESFLKENGLLDKVRNGDIHNISAYHTSTDLLTSAQQLAGTPAIGISIDIGDSSTKTERVKAEIIGGAVGTVAVPGIGTTVGAKLGAKGDGHRMGPMVRKNYNDIMEKKGTDWNRYRYIQSNLRKEANSIEYQTQESIQIFTGE